MTGGGFSYQFARFSPAEKLITINVAVFLVINLIAFLFGIPNNLLEFWLVLPDNATDFIFRPWTLVTYSFLHASLWHLFFNMLMLYYVGRIFLNFFSVSQFYSAYFLGAMLGGSFFLLSYSLFPAFAYSNAPLVGASAGVMAILIFICTYLPNQEVRVLFFNVKLWNVGVFFVILDLAMIPLNNNPGGRIAHLGGALLGYIYATRLARGSDMGAVFYSLLHRIRGIFIPRQKKAPLRTVHRSKSQGIKSKHPEKAAYQQKIDLILDKISTSGYESLTQAEKDFLFKAGKED
ncbi:MAG: hypothetical protein RLZZ241_1218 [Bacteroidota bacterium]|jgi:membrane associated rhomboid family serine protease